MASTERPQVLLLSLAYRSFIDETYSALFDKLLQVADVKRAKTERAALRVLDETTFKAIIITDEALTESDPGSQEVLAKLKAYIEKGGLAIAGLHFSNFTPMDRFDGFFRGFGLPWKNGDYHRTTFQLNPSAVLPRGIAASSLPGPYSMKVLHIKNASRQHKLFVPDTGAVTQGLVFAPMPVDETQAAVTGAKVGLGYLVYCGDVNGEDESHQLMLALCGF